MSLHIISSTRQQRPVPQPSEGRWARCQHLADEVRRGYGSLAPSVLAVPMLLRIPRSVAFMLLALVGGSQPAALWRSPMAAARRPMVRPSCQYWRGG
jgi:hypothetical protein